MDNKKERILESTLKLITERGFHNTPVSLIAKEAGVAAGTIYRYFETKDDIINEIFFNIKEEYNEIVLNSISDGMSVKEEYYNKFKSMATYYIENPVKAGFMSQYVASPFINQEKMQEMAEKYSHYIEMYQRGVEEKVTKALEFKAVSVLMMGIIKQLSSVHNDKSWNVDEEKIELMFELFWDAIKYA